jgi:hypothetical protein
VFSITKTQLAQFDLGFLWMPLDEECSAFTHI